MCARSKGPQPPLKVEVTLALLVYSIYVVGPVQFIVEVNTQVLKNVHRFNVSPVSELVPFPPKSITISFVLLVFKHRRFYYGIILVLLWSYCIVLEYLRYYSIILDYLWYYGIIL